MLSYKSSVKPKEVPVDIHTLSKISGLSRAQIDILISRHGMTPQAKTRQGARRDFTSTDGFRFALAARLITIGLSNDRATLATVFANRINSDDMTGECYPGRTALEAEGATIFYVLPTNGDFEFVREERLTVALKRLGPCVVVDASAIANIVDVAHA
jgi:hypothetical protein